jgi:hypothetical protein
MTLALLLLLIALVKAIRLLNNANSLKPFFEKPFPLGWRQIELSPMKPCPRDPRAYCGRFFGIAAFVCFLSCLISV